MTNDVVLSSFDFETGEEICEISERYMRKISRLRQALTYFE